MMMSKEEIIREFKASKNPTKQIRILADINECSEVDIAMILKDVELDDVNKRYGESGDRTQKEAVGNTIANLSRRQSEIDSGRHWSMNINKAMKLKRMTSEELAIACNVSVVSVNYWRRGSNMPKMETAIAMVKALGTTLDAIFMEGSNVALDLEEET